MSDQMAHRLEDLASKKAESLAPGTKRAIDAQRERGKLTARERIDYLLDDNSFEELDPLVRHRTAGVGIDHARPYTDGGGSGLGTIDDPRLSLYRQDFTVFGGSLGEAHAEKIHKVQDLALKLGVPIIGLTDGGGARIQEGVAALHGFGGIFVRNARSSGVIPQISVILGPSAGGAVYSPALTDFIFMVQGTSHMFITGPDVVRTVTGEDVTAEQLGGAASPPPRSGVAAFVFPDEKSCLDEVRSLLSFLPQNNLEEPPAVPASDPADRLIPELRTLVPSLPNQPY